MAASGSTRMWALIYTFQVVQCESDKIQKDIKTPLMGLQILGLGLACSGSVWV